MALKITLQKKVNKPSILSIERADGSLTWSKLQRGMETHDLCHYAVEKYLDFTKAFYGLINVGFSIEDFELPRDQRPEAVKPENLDTEALVTEHVVNLLEIELFNSGLNEHLIEDLKIILTDNNLKFPEHLNEDVLKRIRATYYELVNKWMVLSNDETLSIEFSV